MPDGYRLQVSQSLALGMLGTCAVYHTCLILWSSVSFCVKLECL